VIIEQPIEKNFRLYSQWR